jgi:hypothetical protein
MAVDFELFFDWAKEYFGEANIKIRSTAHGQEICANSIWSEKKLGKTDNKFHLWMNPSGGKSKHPEMGSYRCWLTDEMGSLVGLVSELENLEWEEAEVKISGGSSLRDLEQQVHDLFGYKEDYDETLAPEFTKQKIVSMPPSCHLIDKMPSKYFMKEKAQEYLSQRKLPTQGLYVCVAGDYKNRIVIPYFNSDGELIYYNARLISDKKDALRYMKCPTTIVDQKEVLYMTRWPQPGSKIFIMEGEFDAMTLKMCGLVGCACGGKFMSDTQIDLISDYQPVLAFDADEAGLEAMLNIGKTLLERGFPKVSYVRPPKAYKDWNKLLVERDLETVKAYLSRFEKSFTKDTPDIILSNRI